MTSDVAVIIASFRRPQVLAETLDSLSRQTLPGFQVILSLTSADDCGDSAPGLEARQICLGSPGLTAQRNRGVARLDPAVRYVAFIDDDVEIAPDYLDLMKRTFEQNEKLLAFSGHVVEARAEDRAAARAALAQPAAAPDAILPVRITPESGLYGCSMCVRREVLEHEKFDERLRRYAWLEDADFGVRVRARGPVGSSSACRLYHLRSPQGRISGKAFGFAQIMNPFYLARKGTLPWRQAWISHAAKIAASNLRGSLRNSGIIDYRGRLAGNFLAVRKLAAGRFVPEEIDNL
ncbi:MAG TPA: glycosyltransferase [Candidatus Methylacidiphilales bacterium]|jgi:GT2 family glycosyltransferase|nr:glycosyltransferase [Candidatus Methylacidiphilales bacterium]